MQSSTYGLEQLKRAIQFVKNRQRALDVGCGSSARYFTELTEAGFAPEGLDISQTMLERARERNPDGIYHRGDITHWDFPARYDLITAWDSTFHLPLTHQKPALINMCSGLTPQGVLMFTCGGIEGPGEITGTMQELEFGYSGLGVSGFLHVLLGQNMAIRHLEYDQGPDGRHVYIIAQKTD
jgi:SAM-dependent methyltransferase